MPSQPKPWAMRTGTRSRHDEWRSVGEVAARIVGRIHDPSRLAHPTGEEAAELREEKRLALAKARHATSRTAIAAVDDDRS